ncbi:MAG: ribosomal maturation YjgA family protein [Planctomycetota bacterium]
MRKKRNRLAYLPVLAIVIVAGLMSRSRLAVYLPSFLSAYAGDTLWSLALFLTICTLFPGTRLVVVALLTIAISFSVEFSQVCQAEWLNTIRGTRLGALFLGVGFKWSDLPCYTVGCVMGVAGDVLVSINNRKTSPNNVLEGIGTGASNPHH